MSEASKSPDPSHLVGDIVIERWHVHFAPFAFRSVDHLVFNVAKADDPSKEPDAVYFYRKCASAVPHART
jgi:hypothetical protein